MWYMTKDMIKDQFNREFSWLEPTDLCFTYIEHLDKFSVFNQKEMHNVMKGWRDDLKSGEIYILKENNKVHHIDGVKYHGLVIQGKGISMSKMGLLFDECYGVDGWFYIFRTEKTRDTVFNWLYKYCQIILKETKNDGDECNICMEDDECYFVTRCCNKDICRTCLKKKKLSSCTFCRNEY